MASPNSQQVMAFWNNSPYIYYTHATQMMTFFGITMYKNKILLKTEIAT